MQVFHRWSSMLGGVVALIALPAQGADFNSQAHYFKVFAEMYHEQYEEQFNDEKLMQEEGWLASIGAQYWYRFSAQDGVGLRASLSQGQSDYTGSYSGGNYGDLTLTDIDRDATRMDVYYTRFNTLEYYRAMLHIGLSQRTLTDHLQHFPGGYKRESLYQTAFVELEWQPTYYRSIITPSIRYDHLLRGEQTSHINGSAIVKKQSSGYGVSASLAFAVPLSSTLDMAVVPFVRYWSIEESEVVQGYVEPENTTYEIGMRLELKF